MKKRYLITYNQQSIKRTSVANILGEIENKAVEDISSLEVSDEENTQTVHLDNLEITIASLSGEEAERLSQKDEILSVEEDTIMEIQGFVEDDAEINQEAYSNLWNINMVKAPEAWNDGYTGKGVNLAILDTGIASHPDLVIAGGISFVPNEPSYTDKNGHGTHCAGIAAGRKGLNKVYGVAKNCNLYAVKVLGANGKGNTSWIIAGMEWCIANEISVASMSLGSKSSPSVAYSNAVKNCQDRGVTVVCATGNAYQTSFPWVGAPANSYIPGDANAQPIAVGAVDQQETIAYFSSRGTNGPNWNPVTIVAPGVRIYSTYLDNGYNTLSGTSMACPHVAGLAALLYEKRPNITPIEVRAIIAATAKALGNKPIPNVPYGHGLINCALAVSETA